MHDLIVSSKRVFERSRYLFLPAAVFVVSLLLPAFRLKECSATKVVPGYVMAWIAEYLFFECSMDTLRSLAHGSLRGPEDWPILAGITANHVFALAFVAGHFRRWGLASVLAGIAALCALCILLEQFHEPEWFLWPGYFVWCAAPIVLAASAYRACRARMTGISRFSPPAESNCPLSTVH
jgi:hypothetical protein